MPYGLGMLAEGSLRPGWALPAIFASLQEGCGSAGQRIGLWSLPIWCSEGPKDSSLSVTVLPNRWNGDRVNLDAVKTNDPSGDEQLWGVQFCRHPKPLEWGVRCGLVGTEPSAYF